MSRAFWRAGTGVQLDVRALAQTSTRIVLRSTTWTDVDAAGSTFVTADFQGATLESVSFRSADLHDVGFAGATLRNVSFLGADLTNSDFHGATLEGVDFTNTVLKHAVLTNTHLDAITFDRTEAVGVSLECDPSVECTTGSLSLQNSDMTGTRMIGRSGDSIVLNGSQLTNSILTGVSFTTLRANRVDFSGAYLANLEAEEAWLEGSIFNTADLAGVRFSDRVYVGGAT